MCTGFWSFNFNIWRRRHVVKPSSPTRKVDLAETEGHVGITRAESPVHMGETVPVTLTFPHPYDKIVRRYPLDAIHSTEPQTDDHSELQQQPFPTQPVHQQHQQHRQHSHGKQPTPAPPLRVRRVSLDAKSMRRHTTPILISHRPPVDQLDLDLAYLSGDDLLDDKSKVSKPFSSIRPLPKPPVPLVPLPLPPVVVQTSSTQLLDSSLPLSPSTSPPADHNHSTKKPHHHKNKHSMHDTRNKATPSSRRKRAATITTTTAPAQNPSSLSSSLPPSSNFAKEKYYHRLPPSARYLADIARYPNCVDPIRPWNVLKDDHGVADVKYTNDANDAEDPTPQN